MSSGPKPIYLAMACTPSPLEERDLYDLIGDKQRRPVNTDVNTIDAAKADAPDLQDVQGDITTQDVVEIASDIVDGFVDAVIKDLARETTTDFMETRDILIDAIKDSTMRVDTFKEIAAEVQDIGAQDTIIPPDDGFTSQDYYVPDTSDVCVGVCFDTVDTADTADTPDTSDTFDMSDLSNGYVDIGEDANTCNPTASAETACNNIDDDCNGETDESCVGGLLGNYLVLFGLGLGKSEFVNYLTSETPPLFVSAGILLNGDENVGLALGDFTETAGTEEVIIPCLNGEQAPLELADTLVFQGAFPGKNEWFLMGDGFHIATLTIGQDGAGLIFGPSAPWEDAACQFLFNVFAGQLP